MTLLGTKLTYFRNKCNTSSPNFKNNNLICKTYIESMDILTLIYYLFKFDVFKYFADISEHVHEYENTINLWYII
jgi:hypothetical protein